MQENGPIILFDGVCNLCNDAVQFVIKHDPKEKFRFASLQGNNGQKLLRQFQLPANTFNSFVLIQDGQVYTKSTAALKVASQLSGPIRILSSFRIIPAFIRNAVYDLIAKKRYSWFGKKDACMIPTPALQSRFLN